MTTWTRVPYGCRENPGIWDTWNGALQYVEESRAYPGVERVTVRSYCGRTHDNRRFYRRAGEPDVAYATARPAMPGRAK